LYSQPGRDEVGGRFIESDRTVGCRNCAGRSCYFWAVFGAASLRAPLSKTDLEQLGATIVDPGPGGALLQKHIDQYAPSVLNRLFIDRFPDVFPTDASG